MANIVNGTCHAERAPEKSPPLIQHGDVIVQAHHIGWLVCGILTLISIIVSFWLIGKHLQWYTNRTEQRYIVRILLLVPLYAVVSFASYLFWNHSTPLLLLRDCYESTVLTAFFYLLLTYLSPDLDEQKEIFRKEGLSKENDRARLRKGEKLKHWMFPLGFVKWKPADGMYFLQLMKWGVLQYCVVRPTTTLASVILDYAGLYCEDSWSPGWGHLYLAAIVSISVSIAMYCLLQLYFSVSIYLAHHRPILKLFAVKAVVFLTFWQSSVLSLFITFGVIKDTEYMTAENINTGIGAILEDFEMALFALLHIKAFSYKPYCTPPNQTRRLPALRHAFNFRETYDELRSGTQYMWYRMRGRETDVSARRQAVLEGVFGQSRIRLEGKLPSAPKEKDATREKGPLSVQVDVEEAVFINRERQWLGVGDDYAYGLGYHSRRLQERSEGLGEGIERELERRGYSSSQSAAASAADYALLRSPQSVQPVKRPQKPPKQARKDRSSWWRSMYNRISQSDPTPDVPPDTNIGVESSDDRGDGAGSRQQGLPPHFQRVAGRKLSQAEVLGQTYDDPPPPSVIRTYRESRSHISQPLPDLYSQGTRQRDSLHFPLPSSPSPPPLPSPGAIAKELPDIPRSESPHTLLITPDSFLSRAFLSHTDASHSAEALSGVASSQSHQSQVRLASVPTPVTSTVPMHPPPPQRGHSGHHAHSTVEVIDLSGDQHASPRKTSRRHDPASRQSSRSRSRRRSRGEHESEPVQRRYETLPPPMPKAPRVRRDQIVLPAPLAPVAGPSRSRPLTYSPEEMSPPHPQHAEYILPSNARVEGTSPITRADLSPAAPDPRVRALRRQRATTGNKHRYTNSFAPTSQEHTTPSRRLSAPDDMTTSLPLLEDHASDPRARS